LDLFNYYGYLYGHPLNQQLGCKYYTQLVNGVEDYLNGKTFMIADIKNAHGYTIYMFFASLVREKFSFSIFEFFFINYNI